MPDQDRKLSPAEFLAQLKSKTAGTLQADPDDPASDDEDSPLDFSDLDDSLDLPSTTHSNAEPQPADADETPADLSMLEQSDATAPPAVRGNAQLSELFQRVNHLLGDEGDANQDQPFFPKAPQTLKQTGLSFDDLERLVLKYLLSRGSATGRDVAAHICLPFPIVDPVLKQLKQDMLVAFKNTAAMGDYEFIITDTGRERARKYSEECTYFGSAPVPLKPYLQAMEAQSIAKQEASEDDLHEAFSDLILSQKMFDRLGPAINSGRGMFLFGEPGNGKTSIAERITKCFGSTIWIPRCLTIHGDLIRLFDPGVHVEVEQGSGEGIFDVAGVDQRWVQIVRPTVIAGGELTMDELEIVQNPSTRICEAPLQLKSNCGTLVIDDFGRQTMPVDMLLNRWIVPLEKRYDFLNLPSGKKIQMPFDQLIIFSTNLEPKDLVDGAFLRRIPYKIEVPDPSFEEFLALFELMSPLMGFEFDREAFDYLVETHYRAVNRPFRACQPRDLLLQVKNYCTYKRLPKLLTPEAFDFAVENYFSVL